MNNVVNFLTKKSGAILILNDGIATYHPETNSISHESMGMEFNLNEVKNFRWVCASAFMFDTDENSWYGCVSVIAEQTVVNNEG